MKITIEAEAKEIAELLTVAVSNERLIDNKIAEAINKISTGFSKVNSFPQELLKELLTKMSSQG